MSGAWRVCAIVWQSWRQQQWQTETGFSGGKPKQVICQLQLLILPMPALLFLKECWVDCTCMMLHDAWSLPNEPIDFFPISIPVGTSASH